MRVLVLGGNGMLGHQLFLRLRERHDVRVTLRGPAVAPLFPAERCVPFVDVRHPARLAEVFAAVAPEAVVNAAGLVKQRPEARDPAALIEVNGHLPHRLATLCREAGARLVHVSTDCVFSGSRGGYDEDDPADPSDDYGRSKLLGEVREPPCLTLRTSMIGPELAGSRQGLLAWFLGERGPVRGFSRAVFSGLSTPELARVIERLLVEHPDASGLYHVASRPISKLDLLRLAARAFRHDVEIVPDDGLVCDRSLRAERFAARFGYLAPPWEAMMAELAA